MEKIANENAAMFYGEDAAAADRSLFVENVGRLAALLLPNESMAKNVQYAKVNRF